MKIPKTSDMLGIINKIAPTSLAETWDNPGLQIGDPAAEVTRVMVALDPTPDVINSALKASIQLLVTHHPLIFKPLKSISTTTPLGASMQKAIIGGLSIVSLHTNYDIARDGLNDLLASKLGLSKCVPLRVTTTCELFKLVVFVPVDHVEQVRSALFDFAVKQGNYRDCSFAAGGVGTFTPLEGADPFIGAAGEFTTVNEDRLELLIERGQLPRAVKALLTAHPYEEPAFDIYPLMNEGEKLGLGRIGRLTEATTLGEYASQLKEVLSSPALRYVGDPTTKILKVAICSGSGASLLHEAVRFGADLLVTGDIKYHEAREAEDLGLALIDAGHFPTEIIMVDDITVRLGRALVSAGYTNCSVEACRTEMDPFRI
ncbi:MAG: Nif3-like dinuclear metal center hexameric protein [Geobacteraceae bacterium]|nr:Nif3-like dinuclear metal center hexameric protein [Geobacteraceae bacterium]NTW81565.1 Nif3-like dinuclear metal center hexameric protein [Geobacteraceae bacterium]